jgi:hypothetical protein
MTLPGDCNEGKLRAINPDGFEHAAGMICGVKNGDSTP